MHISKQEQQKRYREYEKKDIPLCVVDEELDYLNEYDNYLSVVDKVIGYTQREYAPSTVVESNDKRYARVKTLKTLVETIEQRL